MSSPRLGIHGFLNNSKSMKTKSMKTRMKSVVSHWFKVDDIVRGMFWRNDDVVGDAVALRDAIKNLGTPLFQHPPAKLRTKRDVAGLHVVGDGLHHNASESFDPRLNKRRVVVPSK
jgi:hypothetical protein